MNGLLRQYFAKGTDISVHGLEGLQRVAHQLNLRPRKTLGWDTPALRLAQLAQRIVHPNMSILPGSSGQYSAWLTVKP